MSFNTNYILPGDDKNQIIGKSNYNFSQILSSAMGLPGQKGIIGPTGIIGQVGNDGDQGGTGSRANQWFFQNTPPYGNLPVDEWPLINYDVWVDTSPGSTGGPNRIYYYNDDYTLGIYPFWVDTLSNFIVDGPLTIIQGISGPGGVTENNAIVIQSADSPNSTFVLTDGNTNPSSVNPNYSKVVVSTDTSLTASLPIFSFDKTFYSTSTPPSFLWNTISTDYGIKFSSGGDITIQSYATGSYGSTGGASSVTGKNVNISSITTSAATGTTISATGGITINSPLVGFSSGNMDLQEGQFSLSSMDSGIGVSGSSSSYTLDLTGVLMNSPSNDPSERKVLSYNNLSTSSSITTDSLSLSMAKSRIFQIKNNSPVAATGATAGFATYPTLMIGYTGSTGVLGGTGANIVKGYQEITSSASSQSLFYGFSDFSNYIEVTPSNDVIIITPTATSNLSTLSRTNRIWLYIPKITNSLEAGVSTVFDIFMNSTVYSIGGVQIATNLGYSPAEIYIPDGGTGPSQGCRHVRLTFFGSAFPPAVDSTGNKLVYAQAFVSGYTREQVLIYEFSPNFSLFGGGGKIICNELYLQGYMSKEIREADERFGDMMARTNPEAMVGYHYWALPVVNLMKKSRLVSGVVWFFAKPWAYQMAYEMGEIERGNLTGKILMKLGVWISGLIGRRIMNKKQSFQL